MRLQITKRHVFWAAVWTSMALVLGTVLIAIERHRQRTALAHAQITLRVDHKSQHPFHKPIIKMLESMGLNPDHTYQVSGWLELFADSYAIVNTDHSAPSDNHSFPHLRGWPARKAHHFGIWYRDFSNADFQQLGSMPRLRTVFLIGGKMTDEILIDVASQAPGTNRLLLRRIPSFRGEHLDQLQFLKAATDPNADFQLILGSVPIDDDGFARIARHGKGITELNIEDIAISDAGIESISKLAALQQLRIAGSSELTSGPDFEPLAKLKQLETLSITDWPHLGIRRLLLAKNSLPSLERLTLNRIPLSAEEVREIPRFAPNLQHLSLSSTEIGADSLTTLPSLKRLKSLDLGGNSAVGKDAEPILKRLLPATNVNLIQTRLDPQFDPNQTPPSPSDPFGR